jgi:Domain of unknown function (DUF4404)
MTEETLRQLLARVHQRLSSSSSIDPEARDMLATVMRDIDDALNRGVVRIPGGEGTGAQGPSVGAGASAAQGAAAAGPGSSIGRGAAAAGPASAPAVASVPVSPEARVATDTPRLEILETLAVRFEAEHPSLAQSLRQIAELLGQAGI